MGVPLDPPKRREEPPLVRVVPFLSPQVIVRTLFIAVVFALSLYLIYLLRKPISWVLIAVFLAVALSGPVNLLNQWMKRGFAITIVFLGLLLIPIGIASIIVPPTIRMSDPFELVDKKVPDRQAMVDLEPTSARPPPSGPTDPAPAPEEPAPAEEPAPDEPGDSPDPERT